MKVVQISETYHAPNIPPFFTYDDEPDDKYDDVKFVKITKTYTRKEFLNQYRI